VKKTILLGFILLIFNSAVFADRDRDYRGHFDRRPHPDARWHDDAGWLVPAIIGGALIYGVINSQSSTPAPVQQQPQTQQYYPIEPGQTQQAPMGYHWEQILDASCNCYRVVLVKN
jgi:hypothetical protein